MLLCKDRYNLQAFVLRLSLSSLALLPLWLVIRFDEFPYFILPSSFGIKKIKFRSLSRLKELKNKGDPKLFIVNNGTSYVLRGNKTHISSEKKFYICDNSHACV